MGGKYSSVPCSRDSAHKTFGPNDLTSTYSPCTRRVFGGIEPRPSGLESDALTTRLPTATRNLVPMTTRFDKALMHMKSAEAKSPPLARYKSLKSGLPVQVSFLSLDCHLKITRFITNRLRVAS
ncbi:hypothetical protein TNCV_4996551 [Trichonephila clavipes]|nr:hypothetical protein TNCV_4996551 [Trichonephila clavipes]